MRTQYRMSAAEIVLRKVAERRAYRAADAFMGKCAEAFMTKNAADWSTLRDALAYSELEKEAGVGKGIGSALLGLSMLFGGGGAKAMQAGSGLMSHGGAPIVQQVAGAAKKIVKQDPMKQVAALPWNGVRASEGLSVSANPMDYYKKFLKAAPASSQSVSAGRSLVSAAPRGSVPPGLPPPSGSGAPAGKKGNLGKILAALGLGGAAAGGTAYALSGGKQQPPPPPGMKDQIMALLGRGKQWIQENPGTAAGIGAGALALGGLGYAALRGRDDERN